MSAASAGATHIPVNTVVQQNGSEFTPLAAYWDTRPRYAQDFMWSVNEPEHVSLAMTSIHTPPVPAPPQAEVFNPVAQSTIRSHPHLFQITTPVNVDVFCALLREHPNQPLVSSVQDGLVHGFWPWASMVDSGRPDIVDNLKREIKDPTHLAFILQQRDEELVLCRFSPAFSSLLPGMMCVLLWVIPKPHSDKLRLIVDHSAGEYLPNSYIPTHEGRFHLDTLHQLGSALIRI
jgi:hypothetical protein